MASLARYLAHVFAPWIDLYANSLAVETAVVFLHVGGLVVAGGLAWTLDRAVMRSARGPRPPRSELAHELGLSVEEGRKTLHALFESGIPGWLLPSTSLIVSFAPFNNLPTQYRITVEGEQKWFGQ